MPSQVTFTTGKLVSYVIQIYSSLNLCFVFVCVQDALAPYQHIEEDLKSLKEVLEMKNQQIHQQELKISELEKMVNLQWRKR